MNGWMFELLVGSLETSSELLLLLWFLVVSFVSNSAKSAWSANAMVLLLACFPVLKVTELDPTSIKSNPSDANNSWQPGTDHSFNCSVSKIEGRVEESGCLECWWTTFLNYKLKPKIFYYSKSFEQMISNVLLVQWNWNTIRTWE